MDPRLLRLYSEELQHVRDMGAEFALRFPKVAARLAMDSTEVDDPYVERLLEGFAFLTARVQLRLQEEFPRFTEHLIGMLYPGFLAPVPSVGVVQFNPDMGDTHLKKGVQVTNEVMLQSQVSKGSHTACQFRVCHPITLWPIHLTQVEHSSAMQDLPALSRSRARIKSVLRIGMQTHGQTPFAALPIEALDFFVSGRDEHAFELFERIVHRTVALFVRAKGQHVWHELPVQCIAPQGFGDDQALLADSAAHFTGFRLLQEFFAFPQRYLFFRLGGLKTYLQACKADEIEFLLCFDDADAQLDKQVAPDSLSLNCAPVVNLFEHRCDRIVLDGNKHEFHLQPNRAKPQDFEIHSVISMLGYGQSTQHATPVQPLFSHCPFDTPGAPCYAVRREPTLISERQRREGNRSSHAGSEMYVGFSWPDEHLKNRLDIAQVAVRALCTNRDLPLLMPIGQAATDFHWPGNLPLKSIRMIRGPSRPRTPIQNGQPAWQLIEHLSLNYLGLVDQRQNKGAQAMRQLLALYADPAVAAHCKIANALHGVETSPTVQHLPVGNRLGFARGLAVTFQVDEFELQGLGLGVFGSVLAHFLARYVSVNSFVQMRMQGVPSGKSLQWPAMSGQRPLV